MREKNYYFPAYFLVMWIGMVPLFLARKLPAVCSGGRELYLPWMQHWNLLWYTDFVTKYSESCETEQKVCALSVQTLLCIVDVACIRINSTVCSEFLFQYEIRNYVCQNPAVVHWHITEYLCNWKLIYHLGYLVL